MKARTLLSAATMCLSALGFSQAIITSTGYGNVTPHTYLGATAVNTGGKGVLLSMPNNEALLKIDLPIGTNWSQYTHLQVQVQNVGTKPEPVFFAIASIGLWCFTEVELSPGMDYKFIVPFDNTASMGSYRLPSPPNAPAAQVWAGSTVVKDQVAWLMIKSPNQSAPTSIIIRDMRPVTAPIQFTNIVDQYGQQAQISWLEKIKSDAGLLAAVNKRSISGNYSFSADAYGGVNGTAQPGSATGLWHTAKQNGKWYIIDPLGNRFFSSGIVAAGNATPAIVSGRESAFAPGALPSQTGTFAEHYTDGYDNLGRPMLTFNFYTANVQRRVGSTWRSTLVTNTVARMRTWGFNTAGPMSYRDIEQPSAQTSFAEIVGISGSYATFWDPMMARTMPDVYDPAWTAAVQTSLAPAVAKFAGNNYNLGLYVDNELPWAKVFSAANPRYGLCEDILNAPANQPAKIALVDWLKQRYSNNVVAFNAAWLSAFATFDDILGTSSFVVPQVVPNGMAQDMQAFTLVYARRYASTIRQTLKQLGYKGLYLGPRLLYFTPEVLQAFKENCDVISINDYDERPTYHHEDVKALDAPVLISEVGFGACDMGRTPSNPNLVFEADRGALYKRYLDDAQTWPNLVGIHWYKWDDDVVSGRYWDGENTCLGIVSITDVPYWPLVDAATAGNNAFHQRLLTP